jgi:hypothetical protein
MASSSKKVPKPDVQKVLKARREKLAATKPKRKSVAKKKTT